MSSDLERITGIEPVFYPWQGYVIATIRHPHFLSNFYLFVSSVI